MKIYLQIKKKKLILICPFGHKQDKQTLSTLPSERLNIKPASDIHPVNQKPQ